MAENVIKLTKQSDNRGDSSMIGDVGAKRRLEFSPEQGLSCAGTSNMSPSSFNLQSFLDDSNPHPFSGKLSSSETVYLNTQSTDVAPEFTVTATKQHINREEMDAEVLRKAKEEGCVDVVLSGTVSQDACCCFVSEILKCILYQRQQLPMTYDQLVYFQKKQEASMQSENVVKNKSLQSANINLRKRQQTLEDLQELLQQLEGLFSLTRVPRVLLLIGGTLNLPKELYEINMEDLVVVGGDQCLRVSTCLRQLFRTLFVADLLTDTKPVRLMPTTVFVLAHRDCGVTWFRPKIQFKVPSRVRKQVISLSTDLSIRKEPKSEGSDSEDYVWFQSPMAIKGFSN